MHKIALNFSQDLDGISSRSLTPTASCSLRCIPTADDDGQTAPVDNSKRWAAPWDCRQASLIVLPDDPTLDQGGARFSNALYADRLHSKASGGLDIKCIVVEKQDLFRSAVE